MAGGAFNMFVEILIDPVDEDRDRRGDRAQARHQMTVCVGAATLEFAWGKFEQPDEVVDNAVEFFVSDKAGEGGSDPEPSHRAEVLQSRQRDRCKPEL